MRQKKKRHINDTIYASNTRKRRYHAPFRELEKEKTRQLILDSAASILQRDGEANLTFEMVAQHTGVSLRTLFRHFPNRQRLLEQSIARCSSTAADRPTDWPTLLNQTANLTQSLGALAKNAELSDEGLTLAADLLRANPASATALLASLLLSPLAWHFLQSRHALSPEQTRACISEGLELLGADFRRQAPAPVYSDDEFID